MSTVKINCPKCLGTGLTGSGVLSVCSECVGVGTIQVDDTSTLQTINAASQVAVEVTIPELINGDQIDEMVGA